MERGEGWDGIVGEWEGSRDVDILEFVCYGKREGEIEHVRSSWPGSRSGIYFSAGSSTPHNSPGEF